ncbi:MAG: CGNR zinc finger domain-containing protein [Gemmatimonadetes bacterium]|nr:CGNR zinc finger domain-containing protein [Gemmatimonadota bacterium]
MRFVGGDLALDLVNTGSRRRTGPFRERLNSYEDLLIWAERLEVVGGERARRLRAVASSRPAEAARVLEDARALRETLYRVFSAETAGTPPAADDVAALSRAAADAASHREVRASADGYRYVWPDSDRLDQVLWAPALAASDLLVSEDRARVKECATDDCTWLFMDMSRNRSRRWCDMSDCGNRAKARRHYARTRRSRGGGSANEA